MRRTLLIATTGSLLAISSSCLPDNYFANLLGAAGAELASFGLSELVNFVFPPA